MSFIEFLPGKGQVYLEAQVSGVGVNRNAQGWDVWLTCWAQDAHLGGQSLVSGHPALRLDTGDASPLGSKSPGSWKGRW